MLNRPAGHSPACFALGRPRPADAPTIVDVAHDAPKIKFCGLTSLGDAQLAVADGAWAIGLIFWPHSRRRCSLEAAASISAALRRQVEVVGVFVNPTLDELAGVADAVGLTMVQLHGDE